MWSEYGQLILSVAISALVSTLIAVVINGRVARREQRRQDRIELIMEFFVLGFGIKPSREFWAQMRKARLLFYEVPEAKSAIQKLWDGEYGSPDDTHEFDEVQWAEDQLNMLTAMSKAVGYKHKFTFDDFERIAL